MDFLSQLMVYSCSNDAPAVNSKGEFLLPSSSGMRVVDCYIPDFKLKRSLLDIGEYLQFPFKKPLELSVNEKKIHRRFQKNTRRGGNL